MNPLNYGVLIALAERVKSDLTEYIRTLFDSIPKPQDGKDGLPGRDGIDGKDGVDGKDGLPGRDGIDGAPGRDGVDGKDGLPGRDGKDGVDGQPGKDGVDGKDGIDGKDGRDGVDGQPGRDGKDGIDGLPGKDGRDGIDGKDGLPGRDGKDGIDGRDGRDGKDGVDGLPGPKGDKGDPGPQGEKGDKGDPGKDAPDVQPIIDRITDQYSKLQSALVAKINLTLMNMSPGGGSSGGGSARILDNDDVEFKRLDQMTENAILIFDQSKKKFVVRDLLEFIQGIQTGVEMQYNKLIDVDGNFTYIGEATPGTAQSASTWRIKRVEQVGSDINILWANGSSNFDKVWTDRLSYTYS